MNILAIETSCERASVALRIGSSVTERTLEGHANHSERLLPSIRELLADAGVALSSLDAVAFGAGPGAFTGLRLACGAAQGLAMGADIGVVPVPSLAALAFQSGRPRVVAATDARMGEMYIAVYMCEAGEPVEVSTPQCIPPNLLQLPEQGQWYLTGSALKVYPEAFAAIDSAREEGRDAEAVPLASTLCSLAAFRLERGEVVAPELAAPLYVRDKVALTTAERFARGGKA